MAQLGPGFGMPLNSSDTSSPTATAVAASVSGEASQPELLTGPGGRLESSVQVRALMLAFGCLLALAIAEGLTVFVEPRLGLAVHALLLCLTLLYGAYQPRSLRPLLWAFSLAPLIRIVSLSLPLAGTSQLYWFPAIALPIFAAAGIAAKELEFNRRDLGLTTRPRNLPVDLAMLPLGVIVGLLQYLILRPPPLVDSFSLESMWLPSAILGISIGLQDELVFRGLLQHSFATSIGNLRSVVFSALVYGLLHLGYLSMPFLGLTLACALVFGVVRMRTGSILGPTLAHAAMAMSTFLVWPYLIP